MAKVIRVETESGSVYTINTETKYMRRDPGTEPPADPKVFVNSLENDGKDHAYQYIALLEVGKPLLVRWTRDGRSVIRSSTFVTKIEEFDVPPAQDQPA